MASAHTNASPSRLLVVEDEPAICLTATVLPADSSADDSAFQVEVWADNWSAVYVDGELIGEDSVLWSRAHRRTKPANG